uniref:Src like adaptor n=1 Tax=Pavo cristatus TaxID=9049 RepID=A0A8C9G4U6_PAVCR
MGNTMKTPRASAEGGEETNAASQTGPTVLQRNTPVYMISVAPPQEGHAALGLGFYSISNITVCREVYAEICFFLLHSWLFEGLGREKAEELLQLPNTKVGSFMIRESETRKGLYSLSVRHREVKHYRIFRLPNNWYYISPRQTFQCLEDLVNHYSEVADGLCCVLTTPCLTQCTNNHSIMNQVPPVVMRNKNFNWRSIHRLEMTGDTESTLAAIDDSCLSYGLRESIASYLSLTGDDNSSFVSARKKKAQSLIYTGSKHKSTLNLPPTYYDD